MSLNGLDEGPVIEAYQTALAEAGGWFLLKYAARDAVDLLGRGSGGVVEVRNAIAHYEEKSALYGFVQYRRRKVLLKYVPDGTSRLLLARVTVQFQSVLDKFSPHDTVFSLAAPTDLTETALSAACRLHTASGSITSSTSSLRRRRLGEITEDAEEGENARDLLTPEREGAVEGRPRHRKSDLSQQVDADALETPPSSRKHEEATLPRLREPPSAQTSQDNQSSALDKSLPPTPSEPADEQGAILPREHFLEELSRPRYDRRQSSQSSRPSAWELDRVSQYSAYKSKIKLGPRPSLDYSSRPKTSGSQYLQNEPRPISTLPSSVRFAARKTTSQRPKSPASAVSEPSHFTPKTKSEALPPLPSESHNLHISALYKPPSNSIATPRSVLSAPKSPKSPGITPEKQRLMRALQLRKKQMAHSALEKNQQEQHTNGSLENSSRVERSVDVPLDGLPEISKSEALSDIVHVDRANEKRTVFGMPIVSPVSLPEGSEGPSTQGSSFTEESEQHSQKLEETPTQEAHLHESNSTFPQSDSGVELGLKEILEGTRIGNAANGDMNHDFMHIHIPQAAENGSQDSPTDSGALMPANPDEESVSGRMTSTPIANAAPSNFPEIKVDSQLSPSDIMHSVAMPEPKLLTQPHMEETSVRTASGHVPASEHGILSDGGDDHDPTNDTRPSTAGTTDKRSRQRRSKRRAMIDPIKIISSTDNSEDDLPSDDDFMEELQSAKVEEAKPILVARSPITPVFGKSNGDTRQNDLIRSHRAASNPADYSLRIGSLSPELLKHEAQRSSSAALPALPPNADSTPVLVTKKTNVSSGISKRIKALEMFSSREASPSPPSSQGSGAPATSSPFTSFRRRKTSSQNVPAITAQTSPTKRAPYPSPSPTPEPQRQSPHWTPHDAPIRNCSPPRPTANTVSVTARIIRDPSTPRMEEPVNPSNPPPLNLQRSPLVVEHETGDSLPRPATLAGSPKSPSPEIHRPSISSIKSRRNSSSANLPHSDSRGSRLSLSGRTLHSDGNLPRSMSNFSDNSSMEGEDKKKESRKSRLMKRMSSITTNSRRSFINAISSTVKEEPPAPLAESTEPSIAETLPLVVDVGDVNVQFPDTLLWKRRFMRIDDQGYLILTPPNMDSNARNIVKRYHLSEFRKPCLPDLEREELPNSILLDFMDGATLQCACESKYTQQQVLQALVDAHRAYHQLYAG